MDNYTNKILGLKSGKQFFILRQATYKGITYYLGAEVTSDGENFTNKFTFLERVDENGKFFVKIVEDESIINLLAKNIKLTNNE